MNIKKVVQGIVNAVLFFLLIETFFVIDPSSLHIYNIVGNYSLLCVVEKYAFGFCTQDC